MRDCFFIVADANMEYTLRGMLSRERFDLTLGCDRFAFDPRLDMLVAVGDNDPGLLQRIDSFVRPVRESHSHLVIVIDAEWSGSRVLRPFVRRSSKLASGRAGPSRMWSLP